jgi:phage terminase large subunit-like protein
MQRTLTLRAIELIQELQLRKEMLKFDWSKMARPNQLLPPGDWTYWLILAGRGFGKTRTGAETVRHWVNRGREQYVNLIGATADDARDIMIDGESGILAVCPRDERPIYKKSERKLIWPNGAESLIFTADEPERLRGKQHSKLWADELAAWRYPESWDQAMFGLRLGLLPQAVITTTPKPTKLVKELAADPDTTMTTGSTKARVSDVKNLMLRFLMIIRMPFGNVVTLTLIVLLRHLS